MTANYCSNCGEALKEYAVVCSNCGRPVTEPNKSEQHADRSAQEKVNAEPVNSKNTPAKTKNAFFALILSFFFPGLGQVYNGKPKKGVGIIALIFIGVFLLLILPGIVIRTWGLYTITLLVLISPLFFVAIWIWGLYDAYKDAERINSGEIPYREANAWEIISFLLLPIVLSVILAVILAIIMFAAIAPAPMLFR